MVLGLACGDALGRPVEFRTAAQIEREYGTLTEMVGDGTWDQPAGTITDDTEQALCMARSLVERGKFDPADIAERFVAWYDSDPFDVGNMTRQSLHALKRGQAWDEAGQTVWEDSPEGSNAGNGSVMRCAPLALAFVDDYQTLIDVSRLSSQITHADPRCTYGCAVLNLTIACLLGDDAAPLDMTLERVATDAPEELLQALWPIAAGDRPDALSISGYVVDTLQTALWHGLAGDSAEQAIVDAVNLGGDTDTIGAITGAIAGARFGVGGFPEAWLDTLDEQDELRRLSEDLWDLSADG